jgi:hypothetical protein
MASTRHGDAEYLRGLATLKRREALFDRAHRGDTTHVITVEPIELEKYTPEHAPAPMVYRGEVIGASRQPVYDAARYLLDNDLAGPDDVIEVWRDGARCMYGVVGEVAKLIVEESRKGNPTLKLRPYRLFDTSTLPGRTPSQHEGGARTAKSDHVPETSPMAIKWKTAPEQTPIPSGVVELAEAA